MKDHSVRYGIIAGFATVSFFLVFFTIDETTAFDYIKFYLSSIIYLVAMWLAIKRERSNLKEAFSFRKALRAGFLVYVIANLIYIVFYFGINQMYPELAEYQRQSMIDWAPSIHAKDQLSQALRDIKDGDFTVTAWGSVTSYLRGLFKGFFIAGLMAFVEKFLYER